MNKSFRSGLIIGVSLTVIISGVALVFDQRQQRIQSELESELSRIEPPTLATQIQNSVTKNVGIVIGSCYKTDLNYQQIRAYYDSALAEHGWKYQKEKEAFYHGQYSGGKEVLYAKGQYRASIYYAGQPERSDSGWDYTFELSWWPLYDH